jgi:hypothetical protein
MVSWEANIPSDLCSIRFGLQPPGCLNNGGILRVRTQLSYLLAVVF